MACCDPVGNKPSTPGGTVTIVNVGGGVELYKIGTGPNPFEFRTLTSIDGTVIITQNANTIDLFANINLANEGTGADVYDAATSTPTTKNLRRIRAGANVTVTQNATDITIAAVVPAASTCANVGTGAQVYVTGSSGPFNFRTILSADSRLTVTQNATDITLTVNTAVANEGGFVEIYDTVNSTLATKRLRTLTSSDNSVSLTQNATSVDIKNAVAVANEGGFAQIYDTATSTAVLKNLRTIQSSDGSVTITQNATNIDLKVGGDPNDEFYYSEKTDIITTNGTAYVTVSTMDAIAGGAIGEVWYFVASCEVCHPPGLSTVNTRIRWQIETSAGVFTDLETNINICEPITIGVGEHSSPRTRTYKATLAMAAPRLRLGMSMSAAVATGGQVEFAQVSGYRAA